MTGPKPASLRRERLAMNENSMVHILARMLKLPVVFALLLAPPAAAELVNENLLVELPPGYKIAFQNKKNDMLMNEMVPSNESADNWTEMLTVQIFYGLKATPEQFESKIDKGWLASCPGATANAVANDVENGYPALVWLLDCPRNPMTGKPEMTWLKAVQGNDSFYVVQKAFKFAPAKAEITQWMNYLKAVAVCDSRLPDRACPQTKN
jgi:hypothetical protein